MLLRRIIIASLASVMASAALAQSTAFTYQGELKSGGALANGPHDLRFRLFDAANAGTQVGTTQCLNNVAVTGGKFTATIDFGPQFATIAARFVEVDVRADSGLDCMNTSGYTTLLPRQAITSTPRASAANTAFSLSAPDGSPTNSLVVDNEGNVGVGTFAPTSRLHVNSAFVGDGVRVSGTTGADPAYQLFSGAVSRAALGLAFQAGNWSLDASINDVVLRADAGKLLLQSGTGASGIAIAGANNVGIGTATPTAKLDVRGDIRMGPSGQYRATAAEENLRFIRGTVSGIGQVMHGQGYTAAQVGSGDYLITFNTPFSSTPTVTATVDDVTESLVNADLFSAGIYAASTTSVRIRVREVSEDNGNANGTWSYPFHFIAVGPR